MNMANLIVGLVMTIIAGALVYMTLHENPEGLRVGKLAAFGFFMGLGVALLVSTVLHAV